MAKFLPDFCRLEVRGGITQAPQFYPLKNANGEFMRSSVGCSDERLHGQRQLYLNIISGEQDLMPALKELKVGSKVRLAGYLRPKEWTDAKTGVKRHAVDFYVEELLPLGDN